jgi:uncharacterized protein
VTALLDVNVLISLAWPNHVHHRVAQRWFLANRERGWATCPLTQSGFIRISSNRQILPEAKTPRECVLLLERITELPHHEFWEDDTSWTSSPFLAREKLVGHRQVTDAHLLALALRHRGCLATLDRQILGLVPNGIPAEDAVLWIDPQS